MTADYVTVNPDDVDVLADFYLSMKRSGRMDIVFFSGHDLPFFIEEMRSKPSYLCISEDRAVGFGVINETKNGCRAEVSFGFLPSVSGHKSVSFGRRMLDLVFSGIQSIQHVYGTTPTRNRLAVRYADLVGMKSVAILPNWVDFLGDPCDASISYINRETWNEQKDRRAGRERSAGVQAED